MDNFLFFYKTDHFIPCRVISQEELKMSLYYDLQYKIELPDSTIATAEEWQLLVTILSGSGSSATRGYYEGK